MNRKILFLLLISIGSVAFGLFIYRILGVDKIAEYVALFTSVSTAAYAILAEPKVKTEPILRITPSLGQYHPLTHLALDIQIENIGYSTAKNIEVRCKVFPDTKIPVKNNGIFTHPSLTIKDLPIKYSAMELVDRNRLLSQQLIIEVFYSNEDDKRQKPIKKTYPIRELEQGLREVKTSR